MYSKLKRLNANNRYTQEGKNSFAEIQKIDKKEETIINYLKYIIEQTAKNGKMETLSPDDKTYSDFILPDVKCFANSNFDQSFLLDDASVYVNFIKIAAPIAKKYTKPEETFPNIIQEIDLFVNNYFGYGRSELERNILNINLDDSHSISNYAGKNIASSFERSALAHNLLKLIGLDSELIMTDYSAYNLIFFKDYVMLYDPTNYSTFELDGEKKAFLSLSENTKEEIDQFISGERELRLNKEFVKANWPAAKNIYVPDMEYKSPEAELLQEQKKTIYDNSSNYYTDFEKMSLSL